MTLFFKNEIDLYYYLNVVCVLCLQEQSRRKGKLILLLLSFIALVLLVRFLLYYNSNSVPKL